MTQQVKANTSSGTYTGTVKLTLKKGSVPYKTLKQHNSGTLEFFKYILNAVKGDVYPNDRPGHVKLIYKVGEVPVVSRYGVMYDNVTSAYDTTVDNSNPKATIKYSFVIPETVVELGTLYGLQLESVNGTAYATVAFAEEITISSNTNIELDWELNMCNY